MSIRGDGENKDDTEDASELTDCCMKDSPPTWLDKWAHRTSSAVKSRMQARRNTKGNTGKVALKSERVSRRAVISSCSLAAFVERETTPGDTYSIQFHAPNGLGLSLFVSYEGQVTVEGLHYLRSGSASPAQLCGLISTGDQLVRFNDINIEALNFYATTNLLKDLDKHAKEVVTLSFRYGDHPSPLPDAESDLSSEDSDSEDDGKQALTLVTCQEQLRSSSAATTPVQTPQTSNDVGTASWDSTPARTRARRAKGSSSKLAASHTLKETALNRHHESFLSIFGDEEVGPPSVDKSVQGALSGVLQGIRGSWAGRGSGEPGEGWRTHSELAQAQQLARSRLLYPSAARLSTFNIDGSTERQLHAIAEDIFEWRPFQLSYMYAGYYVRAKGKTQAFPPGLEVPFSPLILSPPDTARYRDTEHLVWDERRRLYVPVQPPTAEQLQTMIDHRHAMQTVLLALEIESRRRDQQRAHEDPLSGSVRKQSRFEGSRGATSLEGFFVTDIGASRSRNNTADAVELTKVPRLLRRSASRLANKYTSDTHSPISTVVRDFGDVRVVSAIAAPSPAVTCKLSTSQYSSPRSPTEHSKSAYFTKAYNHIISKEHSAVRNLLAHTSEEVLAPLNAAVDSEIFLLADRDHHENPFDNARHLDTNLEISLPNILLTYQVLYVIQDLTSGIFNDPAIYTILEKWATTFNPRGLLSVLQTMSYRAAAQAGHASASTPTTSTTSGAGTHHPQHEKKPEFTVYFGSNRGTARNLQVFLEVVSELLTLLTLGRIDPSCIVHAGVSATSEKSLWTHLPVHVRSSAVRDRSEVSGPDNSSVDGLAPMDDSMTASYARKFGTLLRLELVASVCVAQARSGTLTAVLHVAAADAVFAAASTQLRTFVQRTHAAVVSAAQLLDHVQIFTRQKSGGSHSYPLLLCLFLSNLRFLFSHNTALALDLAVTLFPRISPWNVHTALFGSAPSDCADGTEPEPPLVQAHCTYYAYITRLMRSHADVCTRDSAMVLAWLNLALQLDAENSEPSDGVKGGFFATPSGKRKSSYLVTVRNILHPGGEYAVPLVEAMHVCSLNHFPEGVLLLCDRWLQPRTHGVTSRRRALPSPWEHSAEVRQLLEEAFGRLVSELVFFVHTHVADGATKKSALPAVRATHRLHGEDEVSPVLAHLCDLLAHSVALLHAVYLHTSSTSVPSQPHKDREVSSLREIGKLLSLLLEGSFEGISPAEDGQEDQKGTHSSGEDPLRTPQRVANVWGEVLLSALGVRGSLVVAQNCPALMQLL